MLYCKNQPQVLRLIHANPRTADVRTSFANPQYLQSLCKTPVTKVVDDTEHRGIACFQLESASQAYHNYQTWLSQWADFGLSGNGTRDLESRPSGWALLNDNTTVAAPWIEKNATNMTAWLAETGWIVNNVTMAMPHTGVVSAAIDPINDIMQPNDLDGLGIYSIRASVPSPFVNVVCAMGMSEQDLDPLMNDTAGNTIDGTGTALDDIFQWGPSYGTSNWPPVFLREKLPQEYNTVVNDTIEDIAWGRNAIYILGRGGSVDQSGAPVDANFGLCSLRVGLTAKCSTLYNASSTGGRLDAICEEKSDDSRFEKTQPKDGVFYGNDTISADWVNIGSEWAKSIALNDGSVTGNSSNARTWTQLFLSQSSLDWEGNAVLSSAMPSPAEALAVMSGSTLLQSAQDTPFVQTAWNYSSNPLEPSQRQWFYASIRAQQYASGGTEAYQKGFFIVLALTFLINAWILLYLLRHRYWYLDFVDPVNLFPLAMNSPPSVRLRESVCGGAGSPWGKDHFKQYWKLSTEGGHVYMESPEEIEEEGNASPRLRRKKAVKKGFEMAVRPISAGWERVRAD